MKKIIFSLFLIFILIFVAFNYKYIVYNYYNFIANRNYEINNFTGALNEHNKALEYKETSKILHNLGNDFFKLGEKYKDKQDKLQAWKTSEGLYVNSLKIEQDEETQFNLGYVREKIKELQEPEQQEEQVQKEEKQEEGQNDNQENQEKNSNQDQEQQQEQSNNEKSSGDNKEEDVLKQERAEQYKLGGEKKLGDISEEEKKFLDNYLKFLEGQEKQNMKFFNKAPENDTSNIDSFYNIFGNGLQFDDFNDSEKDW